MNLFVPSFQLQYTVYKFPLYVPFYQTMFVVIYLTYYTNENNSLQQKDYNISNRSLNKREYSVP